MIMRKVITLSVSISMLVFILFVNLGCEEEHDRTWFVDIENELSYPIRVDTIFIQGHKHKIRGIQPSETRVEWLLRGYEKNDGKRLSRRVFQISVFRESDNALIMQLRESEIDDYVIYVGESVYGSTTDYQLLFQIKESDLGFGIERVLDFEDEVAE